MDVCWQYNSVLKEVLKAHCDRINDQIKYYLKICTFNLFFNFLHNYKNNRHVSFIGLFHKSEKNNNGNLDY